MTKERSATWGGGFLLIAADYVERHFSNIEQASKDSAMQESMRHLIGIIERLSSQ